MYHNVPMPKPLYSHKGKRRDATGKSTEEPYKKAGQAGKYTAGRPDRTPAPHKPEDERYKVKRTAAYAPRAPHVPNAPHVPRGDIVDPFALKKGIEMAKGQIRSMVDEITGVLSNDKHTVTEVQLSLSFSADGKFLGFGHGGATSVSIKIAPSQS